MDKTASIRYIKTKKDIGTIECQGRYSIETVNDLHTMFQKITLPNLIKVEILFHELNYLDSAGALFLIELINTLKMAGATVSLLRLSKKHEALLQLVQKHESALSYHTKPKPPVSFFYRLGKESIKKLDQINGVVQLIGDLFIRLIDAFYHVRQFRLPAIVSNIDACGVKALPILGLLSFLIGVVLAYQMGLQLQTYGANTFIAYLSGMAIFREFSPLMTAIIVAGRTSSAFTAQLGSMKINEEIDALYTMGLSPTALLVLPKVLGLLLVFPLLIFWSDIFSILGAMIMSDVMLDIGFLDFLQRLKDQVGFKQFMLGQYKAPAFALIIAIIGCFQGFAVKAQSDSIGSQTTKSVVQALFLIIIADAVFSVVYSWLDL